MDGEIIKPKEDFELPIPAFRKLEDMKEVLMKGSELTGPEIVYTMFRKVSKPEHHDLFEKSELEYDITVVLSGAIGKEFIKTVGHYHSKKEGTDIYYPEIYEVISGRAHYLFQKVEDDKVLDVKIIEAEEGDKVIIPPGYGHITINPGNETLVEANIQSLNIVPNYWDVAEEHGECFYELSSGEPARPDDAHSGRWVKNENYENNFEPVLIKAVNSKDVFGVNGSPLYTDFVKNPGKYDFLTNPEKYLEKFEGIYS